MDLVRLDLLPPVLIADMQREARRRALVERAASNVWSGPAHAAALGALLIRAGCWLDAVGRRRMVATGPISAPLACGCGE